MKDQWLKDQCNAAFQEANRCLAVWQNTPKQYKKKAWFAFQMAEERQKMMCRSAIEAEGK